MVDFKQDELAVIGYIRQYTSNMFIPHEIQQLCFTFYYNKLYPTSSDDYHFEGRIGRGSFGGVYKAKCIIKHNKSIVIKVYDHDLINNIAESDIDINESSAYHIIHKNIAIMKQTNSQFIVKLLSSFTVKQEIWLIVPLLVGSMDDIMHSVKQFNDGFDDEYIISTVLHNILSALECLHNNKRCFINTKCSNILISSSGICQLSDVGLSFRMVMDHFRCPPHSFVNFSYFSQEMFRGNIPNAGYKSDVWSVGITALCLSFGKEPHSTKKIIKRMMSIIDSKAPTISSCNKEFEVNKKYSERFKDFLSKCLKKDENDRETVSNLLKHSFIKQRKDGKYLIDNVLSLYDMNYGFVKGEIPESIMEMNDDVSFGGFSTTINVLSEMSDSDQQVKSRNVGRFQVIVDDK